MKKSFSLPPLLKKYLRILILCCAFLVIFSTPARFPALKGRIVFVLNRNGNADIYSMDIDGYNVKQLTDDPADDTSPKWSPDGKKIAFVSRRGRKNFEGIYIMNADGSNQTGLKVRISFSDRFSLKWSPDGKQIVYLNPYGRLIFLNFETDAITELVFPAEQMQQSPRSFAGSPDGKKLVFSYVFAGPTNGSDGDLYTVNLDGSGGTRLMAGGHASSPYSLAWSPDGTRIAFGKSFFDGPTPQVNFGFLNPILYKIHVQPNLTEYLMAISSHSMTLTVQPDGSDLHKVTDKCAGGSWSPDSQWMVCSSKYNGNNNATELYIVNVSNGSLFRLTDTPYFESSPDWSP